MTASDQLSAGAEPWGPTQTPTTALLTDHYELTMLRAALRAGTANRPCVFELFARRLPAGRRYGVVAGVGRALRALRHFRFDDESLQFLRDREVVDAETADWLADFAFRGDIWGYPEGELYFPGSPVLVVESTFAEGVVLETVLLSIYNHDSAIASAASRMTAMAGDRPCVEMGSRRTQELAAVAAARAAYIAGFAATSNLEAGRRYGVPTRGTSAHAFTLLHATEREAFAAQIATLGEDTTLLVDTYDVFEAVRIGVELTGGRLGAVRLDSGDLGVLASRVRAQLDSLGARATKIMVTSDLDEYTIAALSGAPVDGYGVGTALVTGSGHPTCGFVYKLVARAESDDPAAPVAAGGQEEHRQDLDRRPQVRRTSAQRRRHRRGGADRHQRAGPARRRRPRFVGAVGDARRDRRGRDPGDRPGAPPAGPRRTADRGPEDVAGRTGDRDRLPLIMARRDGGR